MVRKESDKEEDSYGVKMSPHKLCINHKKENSNNTMEKMDKTLLRLPKLTSLRKGTSPSSARHDSLRKTQHPFCHIPTKNAELKSNHKERFEKPKLSDIV